MDERAENLINWLRQTLQVNINYMQPLAGDASFRRFFRFQVDGQSYVAMDAPPEREPSESFVAIAQAFRAQGLIVPDVIAYDLDLGFLLLNDFGDSLYLSVLAQQNADQLYRAAIDQLLVIQRCQQVDGYQLPAFDQSLMQQELNLFRDWFLTEQLQLTLLPGVKRMLQRSFDIIIQQTQMQPRVCVHRDYHSRNLFWLPSEKVAIIDFQDAVWGPVTYDLVSLLKDCYINWPQHKVHQWLTYFYQQAIQHNLLPLISLAEFKLWFEWMGIQRHLKAIGIFARLNKAYGNPGYLADVPRTLNYIVTALDHIPELAEFADYLQSQVLPVEEALAL